jgi:hypothetical protein
MPKPRQDFKEVVLTKHRLMLSAAAAALLAALSAARADTEITSSTSTALDTTTSGSITIDSTGGVGVQTATTPAVTINSNAFVLNNGFISNAGTDSAVGVLIDTTNGSLQPPSTGFASTGSIDLSGGGSSKKGIWVTGGHTFYGPITLTSLTATSITGVSVGTTQSSSLILQGDSSAAFYLQQGTTVTSNVLIGGGGILMNPANAQTASGSVMVLLDGTVNGNFVNASTLSGTGPGLIGIEALGGIHSCASDTTAPSGFTCPTSSGGSFINVGNISLIGVSFPNARGNNPEAASAVVIGNSIDGGFLNGGPSTSTNVTAAVISSAGIIASGTVSPTVLIDPSRALDATTQLPRGPAILGPVTVDVDPNDPGYSFLNRGTISAQPIDAQLSSAALIIQGASATNYACLSASVGACTGVNANPALNTGGFLNTGSIQAVATTNQKTNGTTGTITATAMYVGAFATIPRLDVKAETISGSTTTPGTISAQVAGVGQGSAFALILGQNAIVPTVNVGKGASIIAAVQTQTTSPTKDFATATSPFSLVSIAVQDQGGTLRLLNNAGTIQATNTFLTPGSGAVVGNIQRAIDLQASTLNDVTINNSGQILGDLLFGSTGNNHILNVGNIAGVANPATGVANTPSSYAIVAESLISQGSGSSPIAQAGLINFGAGTGNQLNVGGFGYVNATIISSPGALDVTVAENGTLFVANVPTTASGSLNANHFDINGGTLGLTISQNTNSTTPVVKAQTEASLGANANIALQFGGFVSSGFTATSVNNPTAQNIILLNAPTITATGLAAQNRALALRTPFLFQESSFQNTANPLTLVNDGAGGQNLVLTLTPRVPGPGTSTVPGLNLSGDALEQFPFIATALGNDSELGAAIASSLTVYNTAGVPASGINVGASQQQAQQAFSQFSPDVSGGTRDIAIMLTDQATGPVAARQRLLRSYGDVPGDMTLWGQEFAGHINNKGQVSRAGTLTSYKDHGFGFAVGVDGGSPRNGWYGGAFTFYSGDISQLLPRATKTQTEWYMLTGYTEWKGKHVFLDTQASVAYGNFDESRNMDIGGVARSAASKRPALMGALGANAGMILHALGLELDPHISLDGLTMREEGYTEGGGGPGLNLQVAPYFANSLRTAVGADLKGTIGVFGIDLTPEARAGYRYELLQQPVKIRAAFDSTGGLGTAGNTMTFIGPDPDAGNAVLGASLGAGTDTWHLGINYDWVRGNNGSATQVGTLTVLGRI